jgi:hypothetical protein
MGTAETGIGASLLGSVRRDGAPPPRAGDRTRDGLGKTQASGVVAGFGIGGRARALARPGLLVVTSSGLPATIEGVVFPLVDSIAGVSITVWGLPITVW